MGLQSICHTKIIEDKEICCRTSCPCRPAISSKVGGGGEAGRQGAEQGGLAVEAVLCEGCCCSSEPADLPSTPVGGRVGGG
jgi:hypothetical protein